MTQSKLKAGVIGCGRIADLKHFPALMKQKYRLELIGFCDTDEERAVKAAASFGDPGAKSYTDYRKLLEDKSIDMVYVLTPNVSHAEIAVDALEAGKHVMVEKPLAPTTADATKMLDASKRTGKKLTVAYQNRFRTDSQMLYKACRAGDLGEIYFAKAHGMRRRGVPTWGIFGDKSKQGGGPLIDLATHALDLALWTMDNYKPKLVVGTSFEKMRDQFEGNIFGPWNPRTFEVEDSAFGFVKMENGATIYVEAAWAINLLNAKEGKITLCGTQAGAEMLGDGASSPNSPVTSGHLVFNKAQYGELMEIQPTPVSPIVAAHLGEKAPKVGDVEQDVWLDAILNDTEPVVKAEQAFVVTQILEAIYTSSATGKAVDL
jgi:predicted dehydrogenase